MKITAISADVTQLCLYGLVNCWLVREDGGYTLIDTNLKPAVKSMAQYLASLRAPVRNILLTHAHADHADGLDGIMMAQPGATPAIGARELVTYREAQRGVEKSKYTLFPDEPQVPIKGSFHPNATQINTTLQPGDSVGSLRCIATPGHTPGHLSFLDERDGTLFTGDAVDSIGETRVVGDSVWYFPLPDVATWHRPTALESARKLLALRPEKLCCGHGTPVTSGVTPSLERAIASAEKRLRAG